MAREYCMLSVILCAILPGALAIETVPAATPDPAATRAVPPLAAGVETPAISAAPPTWPILRAMPDSAAFVLAFPPLPKLRDRLFALSGKFAGSAELLAQASALLSASLGLGDSPGLRDIEVFLDSKGLAPDSPWGIFVDLGETASDASEATRKLAGATRGRVLAPAMDYHPPAVLVMAGVSQSDLAESTVREFLPRIVGGSQDSPKTVNTGSGSDSYLHRLQNGWGYSTKDGWLYVTNSESLFHAVLDRQASSADVNYGLAAWPGATPDDIVLLTRPGKATPDPINLLAVGSYASQVYPTIRWPTATAETQREFRDFYSPEAGAEAIMATLSIAQDRVELASRVDVSKHPWLARVHDASHAPELAGFIGPGSVLSGYFKWGDSLVVTARGCLGVVPVELRESYWNPICHALEVFACGETVFSIGPGAPPVIRLFTHVSNESAALGLLGPFLDKARGDDSGRETWALSAGPVKLYGQLEGSTLVCTSLEAELPSMRDRVRAGGGISFIEMLDPPVRKEAIVSLISLDASRPEDLDSILTVFDIAGRGAIMKWIGGVREIRAGKIADRPWLTQFLTVFLKP